MARLHAAGRHLTRPLTLRSPLPPTACTCACLCLCRAQAAQILFTDIHLGKSTEGFYSGGPPTSGPNTGCGRGRAGRCGSGRRAGRGGRGPALQHTGRLTTPSRPHSRPPCPGCALLPPLPRVAARGPLFGTSAATTAATRHPRRTFGGRPATATLVRAAGGGGGGRGASCAAAVPCACACAGVPRGCLAPPALPAWAAGRPPPSPAQPLPPTHTPTAHPCPLQAPTSSSSA